MLIKRTFTSLILAAIGIPAIILGRGYYFALILLFLGGAAWEFGRIFRKIDCKVSEPLLIGCVILIATVRAYFPNLAAAALTLSILVAMTWHLLDYERGRDRAATDFAITTAGIVYLGWIGAYLINLRNLPGGLWWLLIVLPTTWLADMAAFFVGVRFGKHPLSPPQPKENLGGVLGWSCFRHAKLHRAGTFMAKSWECVALG